MKAQYVPLIERIVRARSVGMIALKPRYFLWTAKLALKLRYLVEGDVNAWITSPEKVKHALTVYRDWLGSRRIRSYDQSLIVEDSPSE